MKSYKGIDKELYDEEGLKKDLLSCTKNHKNKRETARIKAHLEDHVNILQKKLRKNTFTQKTHRESDINEGTHRKQRHVQKPWMFYEQPAHHALMRPFSKIVMKGLPFHVCGSIPGRGPHKEKRYIERFIRKNKAGCKYFLKFDVKHFYENVSHRRLKKALKRKIKDKVYLKKLFSVIDSCRAGLPIGYYTSQWLGNFYLAPLDHMIEEHPGAEMFIRLMDDVVVFGRNKKKLHDLRRKCAEKLEEMGLEMKGNWQVCRFDYKDRDGRRKGRPLDFMGFKFYRDRTTIRKSILFRIRKKANKIRKKKRPGWTDAASMLSRMGWIKHADAYGYYERYIKPAVNIKKLKKIMSKHSKKEANNEVGKIGIRRETGGAGRAELPPAGLHQTEYRAGNEAG